MARDLTKKTPKKVTFASDQQRPAGKKAKSGNCVKDNRTARSSARKQVRLTTEDNDPIQKFFESLTGMEYNDENLDKHLSSLLDPANMNTKEKQELFWYTRWWQRGRRPNTKDDMKSIFEFCVQKELTERNLRGCIERWTNPYCLDYAAQSNLFQLILPWILERQLAEKNATPSAHGITDA